MVSKPINGLQFVYTISPAPVGPREFTGLCVPKIELEE